MSLLDSEGYIVGFKKMPGAHAGYRAGRVILRGAAVHYTVGRNSTAIGLRGTFLGLFPKVWPPEQYAPIDAVTYHACEHNTWLTGWETEKLGDWEPTTPDQIRGWAYVIAALRELGVPFGYHDGDHDVWPPGQYPASFCSHRSLRQKSCDQHQDYLPDADMAAAYRLSLALTGAREDDLMLIIYTESSRGARMALLVGVPEAKHPLTFRSLDDVTVFLSQYGGTATPVRSLNVPRAQCIAWLGEFADPPR